MPRHRRRTRRRTSARRRRMRGGSLWSWLKGVNRFLRKHKIISRAGSVLGHLGIPYASQVGRVAGKLGYGLGLPGGALRLAGARGMGRRRRIRRVRVRRRR